MAQDNTKKEALFNEVKGSLFEYLLGKHLARMNNDELSFVKSLDANYANVLSQQDRMIRQFYPEMLPFLQENSLKAAESLVKYLGEVPSAPKVMGKFSNSTLDDLHEADLMLTSSKGQVALSIKLNKSNAYVNTKSGGIKSFFSQYFSYLPQNVQNEFNQKVDMEFTRMAHDLHALHEMEFTGNFQAWVARGFSELPGELGENERGILKAYYARIAAHMHAILTEAFTMNREKFAEGLLPLLGFSSPRILQLICFHDFKTKNASQIQIHSAEWVQGFLKATRLLPFGDISSSEIELGPISLQIRVKPMNKFTTTAIKINCSVKIKE